MNRIAVLLILLVSNCSILVRTEVCNDESLDNAMRPLYSQLETFKIQLDALKVYASCSRSVQCVVGCSNEEPLGMEDGRIRDASITASSYWENRENHGPARARLNTQGYVAAWAADSADDNPWIQVEFTTTVTITGLITQGRGEDGWGDQRVTKYQVAYSEDGQSWDHVTYTNGTAITFPGNIDRGSTVTTRFPAALLARFLRILPTEWNVHCSMRFEVIGCY